MIHPKESYLTDRQGNHKIIYQTDDGHEFFDIDEAIEHENSFESLPPAKEVIYDVVQSMQEAINQAIAENRVIRIKTKKSNKELKKEIVDLRGCKMIKPEKESNDVAVVPPSITDFTF
jgi:hypothetical protein